MNIFSPSCKIFTPNKDHNNFPAMRQEAMKDRTARVTARVGDLLQEGDVLYFEQQSCSYVTSDGGVRVDFASVHAPGGSFAVDDPVEPARE